MTASNKTVGRKDRPNTPREAVPQTARNGALVDQHADSPPSAGAHAADHLVNPDATPGAGALPSHAHKAGKEVDGGAG